VSCVNTLCSTLSTAHNTATVRFDDDLDETGKALYRAVPAHLLVPFTASTTSTTTTAAASSSSSTTPRGSGSGRAKGDSPVGGSAGGKSRRVSSSGGSGAAVGSGSSGGAASAKDGTSSSSAPGDTYSNRIAHALLKVSTVNVVCVVCSEVCSAT
jgi:hypothetical protein